MKIYLRLLKYVRPYKGIVALAFVFMFIFALANGALVYLTGPAIKTLFLPGDGTTTVIPFDLITIPADSLAFFIPIAIIITAILKGFSSYGNTFCMGYVGQRIITDIRRLLYKHILHLPIKYFIENPSGTLITKLTLDINLLQRASVEAFTKASKQVLTLMVLIAVIFGKDWHLAIVACITFPLTVYPVMRLARSMKRATKKGQVTMGALTSILTESITGVKVVKAFGMVDYETGRFDSENRRYSRYRIKMIKIRGISTPLMETIGAVGFAATIWYATYRISAGLLLPEDFITFFIAVIMLYAPVKALNGLHLNIQQGIASAERVFDLFDEESEPIETKDKEALNGLNNSIDFNDVSFAYNDTLVLKNITLKVKKGECVAIVGSSGAGKTTFINLIPRFYNTTSGTLAIDGQDIQSLTLASLRDNIAMISQEVILFDDTVRSNIAYGKEETSIEDVRRVARLANADAFITKLPHGYDTIIGEHGAKLSGGERQRLSIARAMLKGAPILIMDEATSALDAESEQAVQLGLKNLMADRTTFVIAHRLSTVRNADKIIVMKKGEIVETGSHAELLDLDGEYARLYNIQFKEEGKT
ncbi:MAG: ATP-binding cassette domain-containing protein [Deltaproteobacteria bacterium]|nr:ATP-binding cassette domain-containing protein [Deltaproteobacteria bacterium]